MQEVEAIAKEDGVFELTAPWLRTAEAIDLIFKLTLPDDQDILTGRLEEANIADFGRAWRLQARSPTARTLLFGVGALMVGILLTLLISASVARRRRASPGEVRPDRTQVSRIRRPRRR